MTSHDYVHVRKPGNVAGNDEDWDRIILAGQKNTHGTSDFIGELPARLLTLVVLIVIAAPICFLFYGSFRSEAVGHPDAVFSLQNWIEVYGGRTYQVAFLGTVVLSTSVAVLSVTLGAVLAWIVARTDAPWAQTLAPLLVVPLMISSLITTLAWIALCAPNAGLFNVFMRQTFGIRTAFNIYSFAGMTLVLVLHYASFAFVPIFAALKTIDGSLEEASYMLGAGAIRTATRMTVRLMWPTLLGTGILVAIFVAENFTVPMLLGSQAGFRALASTIYYDMTAEPSRPTVAATCGILLLVIALAGAFWQRRLLKNSSRYVTIGGKGVRARVVELGRWKHFATAFLIVYLFFAVGLPYVTLIFASFMRYVTPQITWSNFTVGNYTTFLSPEYLSPVINSILLAGLCGLSATLLYILLAYLIRISRGWLAVVLDYVVILPTAVPALVLGVGLSWTYIGLPLPIYGTVWILVIAYMTRFIGQGVRQSSTAMVQISNELAEAARMTGAPPRRVFLDIVLPLLRPAAMSLWTILFILIFMEISMTSLLFTHDTMTLPVLLWQSMSGGYQTEAFAVAVIQATIVFALLFLADRFTGVLRKSVVA